MDGSKSKSGRAAGAEGAAWGRKGQCPSGNIRWAQQIMWRIERRRGEVRLLREHSVLWWAGWCTNWMYTDHTNRWTLLCVVSEWQARSMCCVTCCPEAWLTGWLTDWLAEYNTGIIYNIYTLWWSEYVREDMCMLLWPLVSYVYCISDELCNVIDGLIFNW